MFCKTKLTYKLCGDLQSVLALLRTPFVKSILHRLADTPAGPIFRAADTSLAVPSPAMDVISTPSIIEATQDGDQEPEHEGSTN